MKLIITMFILLSMASCSENSFRKIASYDNETRDLYMIGEIKTSILDLDDFQEKFGVEWVLLDGREVSTDSDIAPYLTKIKGSLKLPDARGKFLRMANNGASCSNPKNCDFDPDNSRSLGSYQKDILKSHAHKHNAAADNARNIGKGGKLADPNDYWRASRAKIQSTGGNETRPKNIAVNYFIKINNCRSQECR